jgi:hemerythrin
METRDWQDAILVGVDSMDAQHQELARLIVALETGLRDDAPEAEVSRLLLDLIDRTTEHFLDEQDLMRRWRYPDYEAHVEEHNHLLSRISSLGESYAAGRTALTLQVIDSLKPWLVDHIQGLDRALSEYLHGRVGEVED